MHLFQCLALHCIDFTQDSKFLGVNNKLSSCQHRFHSGHSCQTQLLATCTTHESLNKGVSTHVIYLDCSTAETADEIALIGLDIRAIWIAAFLHDQEQRVLVEGNS